MQHENNSYTPIDGFPGMFVEGGSFLAEIVSGNGRYALASGLLLAGAKVIREIASEHIRDDADEAKMAVAMTTCAVCNRVVEEIDAIESSCVPLDGSMPRVRGMAMPYALVTREAVAVMNRTVERVAIGRSDDAGPCHIAPRGIKPHSMHRLVVNVHNIWRIVAECDHAKPAVNVFHIEEDEELRVDNALAAFMVFLAAHIDTERLKIEFLDDDVPCYIVIDSFASFAGEDEARATIAARPPETDVDSMPRTRSGAAAIGRLYGEDGSIVTITPRGGVEEGER